jgi:hypothetical protein
MDAPPRTADDGRPSRRPIDYGAVAAATIRLRLPDQAGPVGGWLQVRDQLARHLALEDERDRQANR